MRNLTSTLGLTGLLALSIAGAQQNAQTTSPDRTVLEIIQDRGNLSTLEAAVNAANLDETLSGDGPFTVFAPTDTAFRVLGEERVQQLLNNPDQLAQILTYHVTPGALTAAQLREQDTVNTVEGSPIDVTTNPNWTKVNTAYVVTADIRGTNGVVHVIDRVILPSQAQGQAQQNRMPDVVQALSRDERFSTLRDLVLRAGIGDSLASARDITVFAPTNAAFEKVPQETLQMLANNPEQLRNVLQYHVIGQSLNASQVQAADNLATGQGALLDVSMQDGNVLVGDARVVQANIQVANGTVHAIDTVLLPPQATQDRPNAVEALSGDERFSTLRDLVVRAGLADAFAGMNGVTIFAPTNAAFEKVPQETLQALANNPAQLRAVLLNHVVERPRTASQVQASDTLPTGQGGSLDVTMQDGNVRVGGARVVEANIQVENGIVHAIDSVLLPQQAAAGGGMQASEMPNVVQALMNNEQFSTLRDLVVRAGLADQLAGMDAVTVFAPTNAAFEKVPQETLQSLRNNPEQLRNVLLYHVIGRELMATDVQAADSLETVQGSSIDITMRNNAALVGGARVIQPNIEVSNGVVHGIDTVLLPPQ